MMTRTFMAKAADVRVGDFLDAEFEVADISHGALHDQIRFRNADDTATAFRLASEAVVIRRKV